MKTFRILVAVICAVMTVRAVADPALKLNINPPAGFTQETDPRMTADGHNYVFERPNPGTPTSAAFQFMIGSFASFRVDDPAMSDLQKRNQVLEILARLVGIQHDSYKSSPVYDFQGAKDDYSCVDWHGASHGNDFAGFICTATREGFIIVSEGQDLASQSDKTLPDLKASLRAATYERQP